LQEGRHTNAITSVVRNRQVVVEVPADWPEGCEVVIEPVSSDTPAVPKDSDEPETPEEIEDWLRWYRVLEPLEFSPEEEADLAAWRQKVKEHDARSHERIEGLFP
jgi:hypothetical protein